MTVTRSKPKALDTRRIHRLVARACALDDVKAEVEANHDENRWWPTSITDARLRMLAAGWSTRVSYRMIDTYSGVIAAAEAEGFDSLLAATDTELTALVRPLGLPQARIGYLRGLGEHLQRWEKRGIDPCADDADSAAVDTLISEFAEQVNGAGFKVAQCALLTARGYHSGIIPVDSGMVTKLAPSLGITLPVGAVAHERLRHAVEAAVHARSDDFRAMIAEHNYEVTIPDDALPTWWTHLVLIYFKRLHLNTPSPRLCRRRPFCTTVIDCKHRRRTAVR